MAKLQKKRKKAEVVVVPAIRLLLIRGVCTGSALVIDTLAVFVSRRFRQGPAAL